MKMSNEYAWLDSEPATTLSLLSSRFSDELQSGQWIRFRIGDVYAPDLTDLYRQMTPDLELEGNITLLCDGGDDQVSYALVEVPGVLLPMIVPAACLELVDERIEALCG